MKKHPRIRVARANLFEFTQEGKITKKVPVKVRLCTGENPQMFEITLPERSVNRQVSVQFSRRAMETLINTNWSKP